MKLITELEPGIISETEVAHIERDDLAVPGSLGSGKILVYQAASRAFASGLSQPSNTAARTTATR